MIIKEPISVSLAYDHKKGKSYPKWIIWKEKLYAVSKVGLHHRYKEGDIRYHIFSVLAGNLFLRLKFDTETLSWKLEEISQDV